MTKSSAASLLLLATSIGLAVPTPIFAAPVSFSKDLAPILADKCLACHKEDKDKGGYRVDTFHALLQPGDSEETPIQPGEPDTGLFFHRLVTPDEDERMPQKDDPLPVAHIDLFKRWISEGAKFDGKDVNQPLAALLPKKPGATAPEKYPQPLPITAIAWLPDNPTLIASGYHEITLWNATTGELTRRIAGLPERIFSLALHPDGKRLAIAGGTPGRSGEVIIIDLPSGKIIHSLPPASDTQLTVAFSPDGQRLAYAGTHNSILVVNTQDWKSVWKTEAHADWVTQLAFSPDNQRLASASRDRTARVLDAATGESILTQTGHGNPVNSITFSADSKRLFSAANNGEVRSSELTANVDGNGQIATTVITGRRQEATRLIFLPSENRLIVAAIDGRLRSFDVSKKKDDKPLNLPSFGQRIDALALQADGKTLAVAGANGNLQIIDLTEKKLIKTFTASPGWLTKK